MAKRKSVSATTTTPSPEPLESVAQEYTVLARRYRPRQFSDLVGQEPVAQALINALQSNRVAHAYLFTGARGVGKTSTARILAKALNCVKGPTPTPCDACEICQGIATGEDIDVLEIDGASNNRIDEIRELRANVQYRPSRARYKIYIIDEVHMLTNQAFNGLLKTLEEPPPHVKFIFATTEVQKIPITILSRCQRFDFAGIGTPRIAERLKDIVARENKQADDEALELVARRAGGSMRDAQSLLDQLLAFGADRLTAEEVHKLLGTANEDRLASLATAVLEHDAAKALDLLDQGVDLGAQLGELADQLMEYWRDLMVVHCSGGSKQIMSVTGSRREALETQAKSLSLDTILAGLDILSMTKGRMRSTSHARLLLEIALVRLSRLEDLVPLSQLAQWINQNGGAGQGPRREVSPQAAPRQPVSAGSVPAEDPEKKKPERAVEVENPISQVALTQESLPRVWQQVHENVGVMLSGKLRMGNVAISGPSTLVVRFPSHYNWRSDTYFEPSRLSRIEEILGRLTGQKWNLRLESEAANGAEAGPQVPEQVPGETAAVRGRRQRQEVGQLPVVDRAMEVLGAQIVQMDDGFGTPAAEPVDVPDSGEES